jgi:hypothetical protein
MKFRDIKFNAWTTLLLNLWLIISVIFYNTDAQTVVVIFFVELMIFGIFRFLRLIRLAKKSVHVVNATSYSNIIVTFVVVIGTIAVIFTGINTSAQRNNLLTVSEVISNNIIIIIYILISEIIATIIYFSGPKPADMSFSFTIAKLLMLVVFWYPLLIITQYIPSENNSTIYAKALAIACILGKSAVDYWIIKKTE